jgi:hypothetical protein
MPFSITKKNTVSRRDQRAVCFAPRAPARPYPLSTAPVPLRKSHALVTSDIYSTRMMSGQLPCAARRRAFRSCCVSPCVHLRLPLHFPRPPTADRSPTGRGTTLRNSGLDFFQLSHELSGSGFRIDTTSLANPKEFHHVEPAFAEFQTPNQTALALEFLRKLTLVQSSFLTHFDQHLIETFTLPRINGLVHARILRA